VASAIARTVCATGVQFTPLEGGPPLRAERSDGPRSHPLRREDETMTDTLPERTPICVACVGDRTNPDGGPCLRCKGTGIDPDPMAPTGISVAS